MVEWRQITGRESVFHVEIMVVLWKEEEEEKNTEESIFESVSIIIV